MRKLCLVVAFVALPLTAAAQQADREHHERRADDRGADQRSRGTPNTSPSSATPTPAPAGALPPIGLPPVAKPAVPAWEKPQAPWWERQATPVWERPSVPAWERKPTSPPPAIAPHRDDRDRTRDYRFFPTTIPGGPVIYVVPTVPAATAPAVATVPANGSLRIDLEPRAVAQVFVDGVFVGTPEDHGGELTLAPGVRHVELRARGYKTLAFDAEILSDTQITYRGMLEEDPPRSTSPAPAAPIKSWSTQAVAPTTIYLIPGCYLGNIQPKAEDLKPGCDIRTLIKRAP